jgi:hypothetical protein
MSSSRRLYLYPRNLGETGLPSLRDMAACFRQDLDGALDCKSEPYVGPVIGETHIADHLTDSVDRLEHVVQPQKSGLLHATRL